MSLSVKGLSEIISYSNQNKLQVVVVLDPDANMELAIQILKKNNWPLEYSRKNESKKLIMRGARIHFPSYHFVSNGRFTRPTLPGYKLYAELDEFRKARN